jgi:hypothetical protein
MRNILFIWAIIAFLGSCTQDNVHMPETTTDTLRVVEHDTIKVTNENLSLFVGDNKVLVGGTYEYHSTILYQVLKNNDNTIDVIVPEYELKATIMGDLTIGKYTIRNIPYNTAKGSYYKEYADGTMAIHIKSVPTSGTGMDGDYIFNNNTITTSIEVKTDGTNANIVNNYSIGNMPFPIETTLTGKKQ